jgi:hypothetical protein
MTPLEPIRSVSPDNSANSANSGQFSGEDEHAAELVDIGRRIADEETRDAVTGDRAEEVGPEPDAIHMEVPPEDETEPLPYSRHPSSHTMSDTLLTEEEVALSDFAPLARHESSRASAGNFSSR